MKAAIAFSLLSNLTSEGAVYRANKLIADYNKKFGKNIKLTPEQTTQIRINQETAFKLPDGYEKDVALAKSLKYVQDIIPKRFGQKLKAYRNISLLLNPKTLGRNIVGNSLFNSVDAVSKTLAVPIDKAIGAFTKQRTRNLSIFD